MLNIGWRVARRVRPALVLLMVAMVAACGVFPDRTLRYQQVQLGEPLKLPEDHPRRGFTGIYAIPEVVGTGDLVVDGRYRLPRPPDLTGQILDETYRVEESADQTWLLANEVPGRVWPAVSGFLGSQGVQVAMEDPQQGLKQTGILNYSQRARQWLGLEDTDDEDLLVLQLRISHGVQARSSEVQARLRTVESTPESVLSWQKEPGDSAREQSVLQDLMAFLRETEETKTYSRVALNLPREERVTAILDGAAPYLRLDLGFDRAWHEVNRGLSELEAAIVEADRDQGVWEVDARTVEERERGWWFWRREGEPVFNTRLRMETSDDHIRLYAERAPEYDGEDRSRELLTDLLDSMR